MAVFWAPISIRMLRKIRVYINAQETSTFVVTWCGTHSEYTAEPGEYLSVILEQTNQDNSLEITCIAGKISVGPIDVNHSWTVNPYFRLKYPDIAEQFLSNGCDLSLVSEDFLNDINTQSLFISTGENKFGAIENLKINPTVNGTPVLSDWITVDQGETFATDVYITEAAVQPDNIEQQSQHKVQWIRDYDQQFIDNLDKRFHEYVDKKLENPALKWNNNLFAGYDIPYIDKVRIQSQLLNNVEFIKNQHIVDLGPHKGQFLYPCIELGCASITGVQPLEEHNTAITQACYHLGHGDIAKSIWGDAYDLDELIKLCKGKDTLLCLGLIYHLNNHYALFDAITQSDVSAVIVDRMVEPDDLEHYTQSTPSIDFRYEAQGPATGIELHSANRDLTWVGKPNAAWITNTLTHMGWKIKSTTMSSYTTLVHPQYRHRGVVTAYR